MLFQHWVLTLMNMEYTVVIQAVQLPKISQYELLSRRWADPRSLGSYIETSDERRFEISKNLNINIV